jgi:hypothetical protein
MHSDLKISLRPESPRSQVPILVDLEGAGADIPVLSVSSRGRELFLVSLAPRDGGYGGSFWVGEPGSYRLTARAGAREVSRDVRVTEQFFLPFAAEFGAFSLALALAAGGLVLWFRSRKKAGSTSRSSPP